MTNAETLLNGEMRRIICGDLPFFFNIDSLISIVFSFELVEEGWPHVMKKGKSGGFGVGKVHLDIR